MYQTKKVLMVRADDPWSGISSNIQYVVWCNSNWF